jgi:hypothetical protein
MSPVSCAHERLAVYCCQLTLSKAAQGGWLEETSGVDGQHRDPIGVLEALISKKYIEIVSLRTGEEDLRNMAFIPFCSRVPRISWHPGQIKRTL